MIILRINNADLPSGWTHDSTDWQISETEDFSDILVESLNDEENLTTIIFNNKLDLGKEYYGRARMLLSKGFTEWSNIDVFTPKDVDEVTMLMDIPSVITTPTLTTNYDKNSHPTALFKINVENGFSTLGNATHESTTWIVSDMLGNVLWSSIDDKVNLVHVVLPFILPTDKVYHIHAMLKGTNGDNSQIGTITLYPSNDTGNPLNRIIYRQVTDGDLEIEHPYVEGLDLIEYEVYNDDINMVTDDTVESFFTLEETVFDVIFPSILRMRTTVNDIPNEWTTILIFTVENIENRTGGNIPYPFDVDAEIVEFPLPFPIKFNKVEEN